MPLYDTEYTHALIMAMVCSLAAFLLCWLWSLASAELRRHGAAKMFLFAALAVPLALWSVGKVGGGDPDGGVQMGGLLSPPACVASADPPASDSGAPTNLQFTAFHVSATDVVWSAAWPDALIPYGSRIELHEKLHSLTNTWSPRGAYIVDVGQTNLLGRLPLGTNAPSAAFYSLYADALCITFPEAASVVRASTGRRLSVVADTTEIPVQVARAERPAKYPPCDPDFAEDPFSPVAGLAYDSTNGLVTAETSGAFTLATGDELVVLAPRLTFGTPHDYAGESLVYDEASDTYRALSAYPLDAPCLWEGWHSGTNSAFGCTCMPELSLGADVAAYPEITNTVSVVDGLAVAKVFLGDALVWSNACEHAKYAPTGGRSDFLSDDGCSGCGTCAAGDCDMFDGPSVGSIRFRVALGTPSAGKVSGFLWFDREAVFTPQPSSFALLPRADAHVADTTSNNVRTVVCSDRGGLTLAVEPIDGGVRIVSTFTASGESNRTWRITREGGAMRFRKYSAGGNLMSDVSYAPTDGAWSVTDNVSGRTDTTRSTGNTLTWNLGYRRTVETVAACGGVTGSHVRVVSEAVGPLGEAVLRETERREKRADGSWTVACVSYWEDGGSRRQGQPRLVWGDDRSWSWTDYDELGREVLRLDQRDGAPVPEDLEYSLTSLPSVAAFATVLNYTPHAGDSVHADDRERPRTVSRYAVAEGAATLLARTWRRYVRGTAPDGLPTVAETTIRAASPNAPMEDPGNAVSTVVRYDAESSVVPYLLRGEIIAETDADGVSTTNAYSVSGGILTRTSRKYRLAPFPTFAYEERDLDYGHTLYEATCLADAPSVAFGARCHAYDSRNRLVSTQYDDGSAETNAYSCCRLVARIDRTGATTRYCAPLATAELYNAEEEVYLAQLPRGGDFAYDTKSFAEFRDSFRSTRRWFDAYGNETNTVVRHEKTQGVSTNMYPDADHFYVTTETSRRPYGLPGITEHVDARGLKTVGRDAATATAEISVFEEIPPDADLPDVVVTNISVRGGETRAVRAANGHLVTVRRFSTYGSDGRRRDFETTETEDGGIVTNSAATRDFLDRVVLVRTPTTCVTNIYDGASSRIAIAINLLSGVATTNIYDACGERVGEAARGIRSEAATSYVQADDVWWRVEAESVSAGGVTNTTAETWTQLTGLSDACRSRTRRYADGALVETAVASFDSGTCDLTEMFVSATDGTHVRKSRFGRTLEETSPAGTVWTYYDFFGWPFYAKRAQPGGVARKDRFRQATKCGDLGEDGVFAGSGLSSVRWRRFGYDARGNRLAETNALGEAVLRAFDANGRATSEDGDTYPLRFGYDAAGRRTTLSTTRDGADFDVTRWDYDAGTGFCTNKVYADGTRETYSYTADALSLRRTRPDGSWTENVYNANRRAVGEASSDLSCAYGLSLDAFGRTVAASNGVTRYEYTLANCCGIATNETALVGAQTFAIGRTVDAYGRVTSLSHDGVADFIDYDPLDGAVAAISNAEAVATYAYTADRRDAGYTIRLADGTAFTRAVKRNGLHFREEVHAVTNCSPSATNAFGYAYDALNRPIARNADAFAYNGRGEVAGATVGGASATYAYDGIGNLATSIWNTAATTYSANALNQYMSIFSTGGFSWPEYSVNGELTSHDGHWLAYDAKSRLVSVHAWVYDEEGYAAGTIDYPWVFACVVSNVYDHLDRRVQKITPEVTHTYFYDGWLLIKEIVANTNGTTEVIDYHWGRDLSGTIGGAGGVGGLLYLSISTSHSTTPQLYVPFYDAYGNVMGYWDAQGSVVAEYAYDAFGKLISSSGLMTDLFAIRYSTKYFDSETGLYYYGYRFYSPELKRWLTRDPIGEEGGVNLYAMSCNRTVYCCDCLGLFLWYVLYYDENKGSSNFKKSAETYKRHIEKQSTFDPKCDSVEIYAIRTKTDFYARWNQFAIQSRKESNASNRYKVKALHLFTHSGLGQLYLHKEALSAQHLQKLKRLNWADGAELVCHGCSSGVENKFGNSVAGSFYKSQKISTLGQAAASSFSSEPNTKSKWGVVFGTSTDVYLWAFDSDGNAIEAIKYPKTDKETR